MVNFTLLPSTSVLIHSSGILGSAGTSLKCGSRSAMGLCSKMLLRDIGIFRPVSSRKILSMGVSARAGFRWCIQHLRRDHTPPSHDARNVTGTLRGEIDERRAYVQL